jgi:hypothetical protein
MLLLRSGVFRGSLGKKITQLLAIPCAALVFQKVMALLKVPLLDWPEKRFDRGEILA